MYTARYLGPSNYGLISYASSVVAFVTPIMQLGLSSTLVQEFIADPESEGNLLGTSLVLNIISAIACIVGVVTFTYIANPGEKVTLIVCSLYSLTLVFQASEMTRYWFQAKLLSKYPSLVSLIAYTVVSIYKIFLLITGKSIRWFAITHVIEACIISVLLFIIYIRVGGKRLRFSLSLGKKMLSKSKYYIIAGMMMVIYQQTDRIMLKLMLDESATGYYSAALSCIGMSGFVFSAILDTARPTILESKKESQEVYERRIILLSSVIVMISLLQSVGMTIFAKPLIWIIYGEQYFPAIPVLKLAVWYVAFGYIGSVRNIWILAEEKQRFLWIVDLSGAACNVLCNFLFIPALGVCGAALASMVTQFFANVILCFAMKTTRDCGILILKGLHPRRVTELIGILKNRS